MTDILTFSARYAKHPNIVRSSTGATIHILDCIRTERAAASRRPADPGLIRISDDVFTDADSFIAKEGSEP